AGPSRIEGLPPPAKQPDQRSLSRTSMGSMKSLAVPVVMLVSMCAVGAQTNDPVALAAKVQQRYNGIKDISGDFVQTYEGGVLRTKTTERGTIAIKRPGRMRFVYTKPEKK